MKLDEMYPSRWLKAADVGKGILATIQGIGMEDVGDDGEKPVLSFVGDTKPLVLNRTNANMIGGLYGEDTKDWIGKSIVLFVTKVPFQGRMTDAIRVRAPRPAAPQPPPPQPILPGEDDVPF